MNTIKDLILGQDQAFNRSSKYQSVNTQGIINSLEADGFEITDFQAAKVRKTSKIGFQKHLLRITRPDLQFEFKGITDSRPEIVLINSHDGSTSLKLMIGIYRFICANGLMVGDTFDGYSIRHVGNDIQHKINESLDDIKRKLPLVAERIEAFQNLQLTHDKALEFAHEASKIILPDSAQNVNLDDFLKVRRSGDHANSLWGVYNRIQETALRGGARYQTIGVEKVQGGHQEWALKNNTSRVVKSIDKKVSINKNLWDLAEKMAA